MNLVYIFGSLCLLFSVALAALAFYCSKSASHHVPACCYLPVVTHPSQAPVINLNIQSSRDDEDDHSLCLEPRYAPPMPQESAVVSQPATSRRYTQSLSNGSQLDGDAVVPNSDGDDVMQPLRVVPCTDNSTNDNQKFQELTELRTH